MTFQHSKLFAQFENLEINPGEFGHQQHLQVAFEMLHKYSYIEACARYSSAINTMAKNAGAPEKFNVTIT